MAGAAITWTGEPASWPRGAVPCQQPVIMVFEGAHWIDPTSRELLDLTVERVSVPVLGRV
jgi:hypothetical protein